ncbi:41007_t:CDS:1, partial [Gigaspora margarita]
SAKIKSFATINKNFQNRIEVDNPNKNNDINSNDYVSNSYINDD